MLIRALIADDEPLARRGLKRLLEAHADVELVAECADGEAAIDAIASVRPDLALLDIRMPGADGFGVLEHFDPADRPEVIFVTAYDEHAVRAFDVDAVDYLTKPYSLARFGEALDRARARIARRASTDGGPGATPRRFLVRTHGRVLFVPVDDVDWFESADNYVRLHEGDRSHLVRRTLQSLEAELDPATFLRVHRRAIVRRERIASLDHGAGGEAKLVLTTGAQVPVGRTFRAKLRAALEA